MTSQGSLQDKTKESHVKEGIVESTAISQAIPIQLPSPNSLFSHHQDFSLPDSPPNHPFSDNEYESKINRIPHRSTSPLSDTEVEVVSGLIQVSNTFK